MNLSNVMREIQSPGCRTFFALLGRCLAAEGDPGPGVIFLQLPHPPGLSLHPQCWAVRGRDGVLPSWGDQSSSCGRMNPETGI